MNLISLSTPALAGIIVGAVVVVAIAVVLLVLFLRKKEPIPDEIVIPQPLKDKKLIEKMAKTTDVLLVIAKDSKAAVERLEELKQKILYLIASDKEEVLAWDGKIFDKLTLLREQLQESERNEVKTNEIIDDIFVSIADRNVAL